MIRLSALRPIAAAAFIAAAVMPALAQAQPASGQPAFTAPQRDAIGLIIKDYLVKNPEVLQEALAELERRTQENQKRAQLAALKETRETLNRSPRGSVVGNPSGDVTLVEFFDYNCGYCKRALSDLRILIKADPKLKVVLKDLPVLGPDSVEASRVALAAKPQLSGDRLFEYHARMLETRGRVNGERGLAVAREMGLDIARLQRDLEGPEVKAALQENSDLSEKLGINGTPAFILGDEVISGAVGVEPLRVAITAMRKCGQAIC